MNKTKLVNSKDIPLIKEVLYDNIRDFCNYNGISEALYVIESALDMIPSSMIESAVLTTRILIKLTPQVDIVKARGQKKGIFEQDTIVNRIIETFSKQLNQHGLKIKYTADSCIKLTLKNAKEPEPSLEDLFGKTWLVNNDIQKDLIIQSLNSIKTKGVKRTITVDCGKVIIKYKGVKKPDSLLRCFFPTFPTNVKIIEKDNKLNTVILEFDEKFSAQGACLLVDSDDISTFIKDPILSDCIGRSQINTNIRDCIIFSIKTILEWQISKFAKSLTDAKVSYSFNGNIIAKIEIPNSNKKDTQKIISQLVLSKKYFSHLDMNFIFTNYYMTKYNMIYYVCIDLDAMIKTKTSYRNDDKLYNPQDKWELLIQKLSNLSISLDSNDIIDSKTTNNLISLVKSPITNRSEIDTTNYHMDCTICIKNHYEVSTDNQRSLFDTIEMLRLISMVKKSHLFDLIKSDARQGFILITVRNKVTFEINNTIDNFKETILSLAKMYNATISFSDNEQGKITEIKISYDVNNSSEESKNVITIPEYLLRSPMISKDNTKIKSFESDAITRKNSTSAILDGVDIDGDRPQ